MRWSAVAAWAVWIRPPGQDGGVALASRGRADGDHPRDSLATVLRNVVEPRFADRAFSVEAFGARGGDDEDDLGAFAAAIRAANVAGGGVVTTKPGAAYLLEGSLTLLSGVQVSLGAGSSLRWAADASKYAVLRTFFEGTEVFNYAPLVRAEAAYNVSIVGAGLLDGGGPLWFPKDDADAAEVRRCGNNSVPIFDRVFGGAGHLPPNFLEFVDSTNVLLEGFTVTGSPFWTVHPVACTSVTVRGLTIRTRSTKNSDGVDPEGSTNVLIEGNDIDAGDDAIALKAGRDADGWRRGRPTSNVVVRHNTLSSSTNGLCVGSEISGGVSNVYAYGNAVREATAAFFFKSNLDRGGFVRDVDVWNSTALATRGPCITFTNDYHGARGGHFPTTFERFRFDGITCGLTNRGIDAVGLPDRPIADVTVTNLVILNATDPTFHLVNVENWALENVTVNGIPVDRGSLSKMDPPHWRLLALREPLQEAGEKDVLSSARAAEERQEAGKNNLRSSAASAPPITPPR